MTNNDITTNTDIVIFRPDDYGIWMIMSHISLLSHILSQLFHCNTEDGFAKTRFATAVDIWVILNVSNMPRSLEVQN